MGWCPTCRSFRRRLGAGWGSRWCGIRRAGCGEQRFDFTQRRKGRKERQFDAMNSSLRISHVGLRGIVGRGLTAEQIVDFASAFGTFLSGGAVVMGRDPRASSVMLREGVAAGLLACGREVIDLGIVST